MTSLRKRGYANQSFRRTFDGTARRRRQDTFRTFAKKLKQIQPTAILQHHREGWRVVNGSPEES